MGELSDLEGKLAVAQKLLKDAAAQLLDTKRQAEVWTFVSFACLLSFVFCLYSLLFIFSPP
jgi:hypothetical protein